MLWGIIPLINKICVHIQKRQKLKKKSVNVIQLVLRDYNLSIQKPN